MIYEAPKRAVDLLVVSRKLNRQASWSNHSLLGSLLSNTLQWNWLLMEKHPFWTYFKQPLVKTVYAILINFSRCLVSNILMEPFITLPYQKAWWKPENPDKPQLEAGEWLWLLPPATSYLYLFATWKMEAPSNFATFCQVSGRLYSWILHDLSAGNHPRIPGWWWFFEVLLWWPLHIVG